MGDDLPDEYDAIILGTGLVEAVVAAALARSGQKVLHIDSNGFYGGNWATFNWKEFEEWIDNGRRSTEEEKREDKEKGIVDVSEERPAVDCLKDGETLVRMQMPEATVTDVDVWEMESISEDDKAEDGGGDKETETTKSTPLTVEKDDPEEGGEQESPAGDVTRSQQTENTSNGKDVINWKTFKEDWRHFNIDLSPKVLFCRGPLVDLLISSQVSRYLEFRAVSRVLTYMDGVFQEVPSSRADVFNSQIVNIIEKRMLMKFLTFCLELDNHQAEYEDFKTKPFIDFLRFKKLTSNLQHFILYALAMKTEEATTVEALESIQKYLQSIGKYGNTPFLWPLYGTAELPQAFCRMCAVFGGIYILRKSVSWLIIDSENRFQGVISDGKRLTAKWLLARPSYMGGIEGVEKSSVRNVSRAVFITDRSIKPSDDEKVTLLTVPPAVSMTSSIVRAIELGPTSFACPKRSYVVHLTSRATGQSAKEDLQPTSEALFESKNEESGKPRIFWRMFFSHKNINLKESDIPLNVLATAEPDDELGFHQAMSKAQSIFDAICPGEEFMPAPPDPSDIIHDQDEKHGNTGEEEVETKDETEEETESNAN